MLRPAAWSSRASVQEYRFSSQLRWTVLLSDQLVFAFQCHPPTVAQLVDQVIAVAKDIGIRDAKKGDVEPDAIVLLLQVSDSLFFRLMDCAVDLNRQTYLREEEVYDPSSADHMLRLKAASQYPAVE